MSIWQFIFIVTLLAVGAWLFLHVILPFYRLRKALKRLARRDFRPVILRSAFGALRRTAQDVQQISALLQEQDRQIADEGFSLRAILGSMVEGVLIVDRSYRIRLVNDSLPRLFDLVQSPMNRTLMEVFCNHRLQQAVEQALRTTKPQSMELSIELPTSQGYAAKHFEVYAVRLDALEAREPVGVVLVFHDITKIKSLEAVRREFVANVSHEFRTPLAIINGYVETLMDGAIEDREMADRALRAMHKHGQRLNLLIDDLLTISKLEYRATDLEIRSADLKVLVQHVIEQLEPSAAANEVSVEVKAPLDLPPAELDARRIEQVVFNLLNNALRYGAREKARVIIAIEPLAEAIKVSFADNGPGIPYKDQPHIFERFYRVHKDRSRDAGGTGLGLSIVKNVILAHGGQVGVESVPGHGATFWFSVPLQQNSPLDKPSLVTKSAAR